MPVRAPCRGTWGRRAAVKPCDAETTYRIYKIINRCYDEAGIKKILKDLRYQLKIDLIVKNCLQGSKSLNTVDEVLDSLQFVKLENLLATVNIIASMQKLYGYRNRKLIVDALSSINSVI